MTVNEILEMKREAGLPVDIDENLGNLLHFVRLILARVGVDLDDD